MVLKTVANSVGIRPEISSTRQKDLHPFATQLTSVMEASCQRPGRLLTDYHPMLNFWVIAGIGSNTENMFHEQRNRLFQNLLKNEDQTHFFQIPVTFYFIGGTDLSDWTDRGYKNVQPCKQMFLVVFDHALWFCCCWYSLPSCMWTFVQCPRGSLL